MKSPFCKRRQMFLSYRRLDLDYATRVKQALEPRLNADIFMDVSGEHGIDDVNFQTSLVRNLERSDVMLLVVSENTFGPRIYTDDDWVRSEIRQALQTNKPIVAVAAQKTALPADLPTDVRAVTFTEIKQVPRDAFFDPGIDALARFITRTTPIQRAGECRARFWKFVVAPLLLILVAIFGSWLLWPDPEPTEPPKIRNLMAHADSVWTVAYSRDGALLASGSFDGTIKLWDTANLKVIRTLEGHTDRVIQVAFSADNKYLASASGDLTAKLWNVQTGSEIRTFEGHTEPVLSVAFSPDGTLLATGSVDFTVRLWDVATGVNVRILTGHTDQIGSLAFSPDGLRLASGGMDGVIKLWVVRNGKEETTLDGHDAEVYAIAYSPDGHTLVSASQDSTVRLWDMTRLDEIAILTGDVPTPFGTVAYSPDGKYVVAGGQDSIIRIWDIATRQIRYSMSLPFDPENIPDPINVVAYSPDGKFIASGNSDGSIQLWYIKAWG